MKKTFLILFIILIFIPFAYAFNLLDLLNEGIESITGMSAVTVSITVGNNAPNVTNVSLVGQTYAPTDGDKTKIEISFLADDPEGLGNLNNATARANVSLSGTTESNTSCTSATAGEFINYTCEIYMNYYYASSSSWTVGAEIADNNNNYFQNETDNTWTYSAGTYFNLTSPATLAWAAVTPSQTNQTSTTTMVAENTGNQETLNIKTTMIDLGGPSGKYIPAGNFSVFNSTTSDLECESTNQTGPITYGAQPTVGVNNTQIDILLSALARGQGSSNNLYYCLFDVPADLSSETYDTTSGGSWDITAST